jgi:hypothetical protein
VGLLVAVQQTQGRQQVAATAVLRGVAAALAAAVAVVQQEVMGVGAGQAVL